MSTVENDVDNHLAAQGIPPGVDRTDDCTGVVFQSGNYCRVSMKPSVFTRHTLDVCDLSVFFRVEDNKIVGVTSDPTEWNRQLETRIQESRESSH